jgi:hypothetical protein
MAPLVSPFRSIKLDTPTAADKKRQTTEAVDSRAMRKGQIADIKAERQGKDSSEQ